MAARVGHVLWRIGSGVWIGSIVFFSFAVAPQVFYQVPQAEAARFITHLFPLYYGIGIVFGGLAMAGSLIVAYVQRTVWAWSVAAGGVVAWFLILYLNQLLLTMQRLHADSRQFNGLHQESVTINAIILLIVLVAMVLEGLTPTAPNRS